MCELSLKNMTEGRGILSKMTAAPQADLFLLILLLRSIGHARSTLTTATIAIATTTGGKTTTDTTKDKNMMRASTRAKDLIRMTWTNMIGRM